MHITPATDLKQTCTALKRWKILERGWLGQNLPRKKPVVLLRTCYTFYSTRLHMSHLGKAQRQTLSVMS